MAKETKDNRIGMRVSTEQKQRWERTAMEQGFTSLAAWITEILEDAILQSSGHNRDSDDGNV
jgi:predicted DNA binding CopG/RHH family protein